MQDIQQDLTENSRVYFPRSEMKAASVTFDDLKNQSMEPHVVAFVRQQTKRARAIMVEGSGLGRRLKGRFGMEIRAIISGGLQICDALLDQGDNIYSRPRLTTRAKLSMLRDSLYPL